MRIVFQIDRLETLKQSSDSSLCLMQEALLRGFEVWYYVPTTLYQSLDGVFAACHKVDFINGTFVVLESKQTRLDNFDILFIRNDPPVDMRYLTYLYILENLEDKVFIINNPKGIREVSEKLYTLKYPELIPEYVVTEDYSTALEFLTKHKAVILKPIYQFGGNDIHKIEISDVAAFKATFHELISKHNAPLIVQRYLQEVSSGDKRIILFNGKVLGALNRIPKTGSVKANAAAGGILSTTTLSSRDEHIVHTISADLLGNGIIFAGLDVIGGYLTEINVTSPTGLQYINNLYALKGTQRIEAKIWDEILALH